MIRIFISDQGSKSYHDNDAYFAGIDRWAQDNCGSDYLGYDVQDVSDTSLEWDEVACYVFTTERAANWFTLRWA
jgi:hypothetical protein